MNDPRLPPKNFCLSLPALTAGEAEALIHFVDELQQLLYETYADDVFDLEAGIGPEEYPGFDPDGSPDF
jgi:hypothetical protein